jgi:hypothetical protein
MTESDEPSALSLAVNADKAVQAFTSLRVIADLGIGVLAIREGLESKLGPLLNLWRQLNLSPEKLRPRDIKSTDSQVEAFLSLEVTELAKLLRIIAVDLDQVGKLVKGEIACSSELAKLVDDLTTRKLPLRWDWKTAPEEP